MAGTLTTEEIETLLATPEIGVLCTVDADGQPEGSPVWFEADGASRIFLHVDRASRKARSIRRNPKVSLTVDTRSAPYRGVVLRGEARELDYDDARARRIAIRYLGQQAGEAYMAMVGAERGSTVQLEILVRSRHSWDYGKGF